LGESAHLYEINRWIYGDGAFGLRLAAWIARKAPDVLVDTTTFSCFACERSPAPFHLRTRSLNWRSKLVKSVFSKRHGWYLRNDARFAKILYPKRIRLAFADEIALKRWQSGLKAIIDEGAAKPPVGSIDDGQEDE
jgi:hypothetical protein